MSYAYGGTGQTSYTNYQLLIGNSTGNKLTKATTAGNNITITNGAGSITIASDNTYSAGPIYRDGTTFNVDDPPQGSDDALQELLQQRFYNRRHLH